VKKSECRNTVDLSGDSLDRYLRGETVETDVGNGWCLMCVEGYALGLGKAVNGIVKNHYPKGLRKTK
jgi:NOL1/NOP2/fmu family ribosome biogenesis protein